MFNRALDFMKAMHDSTHTGFFGTTLADAYVPIITSWLADDAIEYLLVFYDSLETEKRARAEIMARIGAENVDERYPCGVIALIVGPDNVIQEVVRPGETPMDAEDLEIVRMRFSLFMSWSREHPRLYAGG